MFYEKPKKTDPCRWIAVAFTCSVALVCFVALTFWLGLTVRTPEPFAVERHSAPFQQFETVPPNGNNLQNINPFERVEITSKISSPKDRPFERTTNIPKILPPYERTTPKIEYPTAEILKTSVKTKKARIEMVNIHSGETIQIVDSRKVIENASTAADEVVQLDESFSNFEENDDNSKFTPSKIKVEPLIEGISPFDDNPPSAPSHQDDSPVRKKSEAIPPKGFDPKLEPDFVDLDPSETYTEAPSNQLLKTEFAGIQPDLTTFNVKAIPAFTYLKDAPPRLESFDPYYYAEAAANNGITDTNEESTFSYIQKRMKDIQSWLFKDKNRNSGDWLTLVKSVNETIQRNNLPNMLHKLKDNLLNSTDFEKMLQPSRLLLFNDTTSFVSFGLLAIDLFLLHNVQQIAWNEETELAENMLKDPDVFALNALFLPPAKIQQLSRSNSRMSEIKQGTFGELLEFINGGIRAAVNLAKAFKSSRNAKNGRSTEGNKSTIDCIWTLYCRNLDKTAKLNGIYGLLAKMNGLGLRLMMGDIPVDRAVNRLLEEYNNSNTSRLDCEKLFPKCSADEAKEVVMETALGKSPL